MVPPTPSFLLRQARPPDHGQLLRLARELDSINLPTDSRELAEALDRSGKSFAGRVRQRANAAYLFCAEEVATHRIVAASMIIGKHGKPDSPHYYFELGTDERYSHSLRRMFKHTCLRLRYSMDGPSEVGGLIVDAAMRGHPERIGKQTSWVRFLYIARHRPRFESTLIAEMLAPTTAEHGNRFWDHYGGVVTGLSYREADRLSMHDKEFIRALFPDAPLYIFLLPEEVKQSLGQIADTSRGALRLLEQAGMKFLNQIDPFDAGPYYGARVEELLPVRKHRTGRAAVMGISDLRKTPLYLVSREDSQGFRAVQANAVVERARILVARETLTALSAQDGDELDTVPLP